MGQEDLTVYEYFATAPGQETIGLVAENKEFR